MIRTNFWYIFGIAAIGLILLRLWPLRRTKFRDPVVISFTMGLFLGAFGTLSKQPLIANYIDAYLFPNAAWLVADSLFLIGLCAGTYWVDLMRIPKLRALGWRLIERRRVLTLITVICWMIATAYLAAPVWHSLERGGIDVGGQWILLSGRLAYFSYVLWGLIYLSIHFYRQRRHMRDRFNYIRLTIPSTGITLAVTAPLLQAAGMLVVFFNPERLPEVWPPLWLIISLTQLIVAVLIVGTFFPPAYHFISWIDKQLLIRGLLRTRNVISHSRPDLALRPMDLGWKDILVRNPDRVLATLVNELEMAKNLMGKTTYEIEAPAGRVMPDDARYALRKEQAQFLRGLRAGEPLATPRVKGDTYALARWYSAVGSGL